MKQKFKKKTEIACYVLFKLLNYKAFSNDIEIKDKKKTNRKKIVSR